VLLPRNKHTQNDVILEPSWLVPTLQTQGVLALLVVMVKRLSTKQVALEGGREKEGRDIMVEKLNYGNHGVLVATNNSKVLRKKNTNKERKDSNMELWLPSLQCPSLRFGGDVWGRCKVSQDCPYVAPYRSSILGFQVCCSKDLLSQNPKHTHHCALGLAKFLNFFCLFLIIFNSKWH
jgi:hypothetical protein